MDVLSGNLRFEALLRGGGVAPHDKPLLERAAWLVAPTLGAVVPNWLLAIPRQRVLSFRDWAAIGGPRAEDILLEVRAHLGLSPEEVVWFEHGPIAPGTAIGCGLDHAHLHIIVRPDFTFAAFADAARRLSDVDWCEHPAEIGYGALGAERSYYVAGSGDKTLAASHVEHLGSQFFRRVVGAVSDASFEWDYRRFAHSANVEATIKTFRSLERAARRGG